MLDCKPLVFQKQRSREKQKGREAGKHTFFRRNEAGKKKK
jgi:hypothetical protein